MAWPQQRANRIYWTHLFSAAYGIRCKLNCMHSRISMINEHSRHYDHYDFHNKLYLTLNSFDLIVSQQK